MKTKTPIAAALLLAAACTALLTGPAGAAAPNPSAPSIGITYGILDLSSPGALPASSLIARLAINTAVADVRIPLGRSLEVAVSGGKVWGTVDAWNRYAVLNTVVADGGGHIIGVFGNTGATPYRQKLDGLHFSAAVRWYLR